MIKLIIFINFVLILGQFILSSVRATDGIRLSRIQSDLQSVRLANSDLKLQIYSQASLPHVLQLAVDHHFVPAHLSAWAPPAVALKSFP